MKSSLVSLLVLALAAPAAVELRAADSPSTTTVSPNQERRDARLQFLAEKLSLTPEQKEKIAAIWDRAASQRPGAADDLSRAQRKQRRAAMKETRAEVRAVLTPEQQKIFDDLKRSRRN